MMKPRNKEDKEKPSKDSQKASSKKSKLRSFFGNIWYFIWEENSIWSWIVNIILAFLIIKFIVYPGLGLAFQTTHPVVAVVSTSMEHNASFAEWFAANKKFYSKYNIYEENFNSFPYRNGFNIGDIMVLYGSSPEKIKIGDIIVFNSNRIYPIIHRVIKIWKAEDGYHFQTKGDNNPDSIVRYINISNLQVINPMNKNSPRVIKDLDETDIQASDVIGKAIFRIPYLGWIKIGAVSIYQQFASMLRP